MRSLTKLRRIIAGVASRRIVAAILKGDFILSRLLTDSAVISHLRAFLFGKPLDDSASASDTTTRQSGKVTSDTSTASDATALTPGKVESDASTTTDQQVAAIGKVASDSTSAADQIDRRDMTKLLSDSGFVTDDLNGALPDDDMNWGFHKATSNTGFVSEVFAGDLTKPLTDDGAVGDSDVLGIGLTRTESVIGTDDAQIELLNGKYYYDSADSADALSWSLVVPFSDQSVFGESTTFSFATTRTDSAATSDQRVASFGKVAADVPIATDQIDTLSATKLVSDGVGITDDLNGALPDDDMNWGFHKALSNSGLAADVELLSIGLIRSDSALSADSGTLLNQDYVDNPDYFADDYVGAKRTF